jgi:hypothetical protein
MELFHFGVPFVSFGHGESFTGPRVSDEVPRSGLVLARDGDVEYARCTVRSGDRDGDR